MLILGLLLFLVLAEPSRLLVTSRLPTAAVWVAPAAAGLFYAVCVVLAWSGYSVAGRVSNEFREWLQRAMRPAGTRWLSFLMFASSATSLVLCLVGVQMARWFVWLILPVMIASGCGLLGLKLERDGAGDDGGRMVALPVDGDEQVQG
jgi:hypothetical protein